MKGKKNSKSGVKKKVGEKIIKKVQKNGDKQAQMDEFKKIRSLRNDKKRSRLHW